MQAEASVKVLRDCFHHLSDACSFLEFDLPEVNAGFLTSKKAVCKDVIGLMAPPVLIYADVPRLQCTVTG